MSAKPVSEWIISVGRHEGFIPSQQWIDTQNMLDSIAEKYNRPHRKTNALLAGLIYCPHCGKRLRVISESNRWTNDKPRFKYVCPCYRENECTFQSVDGVLLDEFVVQQLSNLSDEDSEYFTKLLNQRASDIFKNSQNEQELTELKKKKAQLETAISNQVKNLREADENLKRFIQDDVKGLTDELSETEKLLQKLEDSRQSQMYAVRDIEEIKERLLSFGKYAKGAQPDVLVTLIQSFVERIYIVDENDERYCHIFIKGCTKEDYDEFFRATGYISGTRENGNITSKLPLCDSDECSKGNDGMAIPYTAPKKRPYFEHVRSPYAYIAFYIFILFAVFFITISIGIGIISPTEPKEFARSLEYKTIEVEDYGVQFEFSCFDFPLRIYTEDNSYRLLYYDELLRNRDAFFAACDAGVKFDIGYYYYGGGY